MTTEQIILSARQCEEYEQLIPVIHDKNLQALIAAWPKLPHEKVPIPESAASWESLWAVLDYSEFGEMIGMRPATFERTLAKAASFKLIYPGGEIHEKARLLLRGMIIKAIGGRKKTSE